MRVLIFHGTEGNPDENWFPWLARRVTEAGHVAIIPTFPTPERQSLESWRHAVVEQVGSLEPSDVLVGHSLGSAFALRLLESKGPVSGAFLVSGFIGELGLADFDPLNASFFVSDFDWQAIRANVDGPIRLYNGDDDPYVPLAKGQELASALGVDLAIVKGGGHINAAAGFTSFPQLLDDMMTLVLSGKRAD